MKAFNDLGYDEGRNIHFDHRFPAENPDRFRTLAQQLVDEKPDVIIAVTNLGLFEVKRATNTIPIVFVLGHDPVRDGFVESLAHPGGNATGLSPMGVELSGKRLELLKEAVPNLSRVAFLLEPTLQAKENIINAHQVAAQALGLSLSLVEIGSPDEIESAFAKMVQDGANGVVRGTGSMLFNKRARVGASSLKHRLPVMTFVAEEVPYGYLMSYGQDIFFPPCGGLCGQNTKRRKTGRPSRRAANKIQAGP